MYGIIYKATGPGGKVYIGQTVKTLKARKSAHAFRAKKQDRRGAFQVAILEHGFDAFTWEEIDRADTPEELDVKEKDWIAHYDSMNPEKGYNGTDGGIRYKPSLEAIKKSAEARRGRHPSAETRRKLRESHKGKQIGENNSGAKLTRNHVVQIKIALNKGIPPAVLAKEYGVCRNTIYNIKSGRKWAHVPLDVSAGL
jgi:hypothetical protein